MPNLSHDFLLRQDDNDRERMGSKVFCDIIHGHMDFHPLIVGIIDTPQFQRLRNVKQLGPCAFVYPAAVHTRFEHSLGTSYLAGKLMEALNEKRGLVGEERRRETLSVQVAGLCHDLGHGPFSHSWEKFMRRCGVRWRHEDLSVRIFDQILEEPTSHGDAGRMNDTAQRPTVRHLFRVYGMEGYIDAVRDMIKGRKRQGEKRKYLYQIVCNADSGVDVDKWDYLVRDSRMTNVPINFDFSRILQYCRIMENGETEEICYRDKECSVLVNMFLSRAMLHDKVYQHRKVKIIEEMILDSFFLAKDRLNLTSSDIGVFLRLTDHIYYKILYDDFTEDEKMLEAKKILERLEKRNLYVCIAAGGVQSKPSEGQLMQIEEAFYQNLKNSDAALHRKHISVLLISIDMTECNSEEPLKNVLIYEKHEHSDGKIRPRLFEWDKFAGFKPDMKNVNCAEVLVLYKGNNRDKYGEGCRDSLLSSLLTCDRAMVSPAETLANQTVEFG